MRFVLKTVLAVAVLLAAVLAIEKSANCAAHLESVAVQRLGSHLFVRTRFALPADMATGCNCGQRANLNIPDLPRATYKVHVYAWP